MEIDNLINQSKNEIIYQLNNFNKDDIIYLINIIRKKEIIYFSGVGKSESMAIHISKILKSIGFKCFNLDILNSLHGDIGPINEKDALILFSKSGNTDEIVSKINHFKLKKCLIIGITNNKDSKFINHCDKNIIIPFNKELELFNNIIPTNSCISILMFFNIIIALLANNISLNEYSLNHSYGSIGNSLKKIKDVIIEDDCEIGCGSTIDRGSLSNTVIGKNTFLDNQVHVAHNNKIGENCIIAGQVGFAGSSTLGNNVMIGGQAGISGHLKVGSNVQIGGGSGVIKNIPDNSKVMGYPAKFLKILLRIINDS